MLRDPLNVMPQAFMAYSDAKVSLGHIAAFLSTPVKEDDHMDMVPTQTLSYEEQARVGFAAESVFEWKIAGSDSTTTTSFRIRIPSLQFPIRRISVVCGPSLSGKTSLIAALMGDMAQVQGDERAPMLPSRYLPMYHNPVRDPDHPNLYLHKVAYVAQKPWIEHTTIRENILFSESWDDTRYRAVLHQCDLLRDLSLFDNGDLTLTSDRGIALSGKKKKKKKRYIIFAFLNNILETMKHKISLARAVYSKAKTVLIDDIFSTFEKVTSTFIYENCMRGDLMKDRTIIVAITHPDMFWARDAQLFIQLATTESHTSSYIESIETDPEKIVQLIKKSRKQRADNSYSLEQQENPVTSADVIDSLFENTASGNMFEDDVFDEASIIPDSIRREETEESYKSRDFAYATYYSACGGWKYWSAAILFTLLARLVNISESYWLKEGKPF